MLLSRLRVSLLLGASFGVAGCAGTAWPGASALSAPAARVAGPRAPAGETYPTNKSLMFEADSELEAVNVYLLNALPRNGAPIASIKVQVSCPYGLAMDKEGTLYVADLCDGGDVEEFPKGSTSESRSITDGITDPLGLAIDTKQTLYVSSGKSIVEYAYRRTNRPGRSAPKDYTSHSGSRSIRATISTSRIRAWVRSSR